MNSEPTKPISENKLKRRDFISFATFTTMSIVAYGGWKWLGSAPYEKMGITGRARQPLRAMMERASGVFEKFFSPNNLAQLYPKHMAAKRVRINGTIGMVDPNFQIENWKLHVVKNNQETITIGIDEIKALPKTEIIFDFKCIEGWDQIQHWGGVKFSDFMRHFGLQNESVMRYVGMKTPDSKYYVGLDIESALHPQTILAYEMNDQPISDVHGAPLRLIIPVKYGIKNIKRIGTISFSNERTSDFWARQGYDYYSGL